jgi:hypothetical protein
MFTKNDQNVPKIPPNIEPCIEKVFFFK